MRARKSMTGSHCNTYHAVDKMERERERYCVHVCVCVYIILEVGSVSQCKHAVPVSVCVCVCMCICTEWIPAVDQVCSMSQFPSQLSIPSSND